MVPTTGAPAAAARRGSRPCSAAPTASSPLIPAARIDADQFVLMLLGAMVIWVRPTRFARALGAGGAFGGAAVEQYKRALCEVLLHGLAGDVSGEPT